MDSKIVFHGSMLFWLSCLKDLCLSHPFLEKEMATHSHVLAWRIPGTGEPGGLLFVGSHRFGHS